MMTKSEYAKAIAEEFGGEVVAVTKRNGIVYTGVRVNKEGAVPQMYVDEAYADGIPVEEMVARYKEALEKSSQYDLDWLNDWKMVREKIKVRLYNAEKNRGTEVCRSAKGYGFPDLIIVPYVTFDVGEGKVGSMQITDDHVKAWGVTKRTVIDCGIKNIKVNVAPMGPFVYVSTENGFSNYGAAGVLKAKEKLDELCPNGYYIIPSSVHEVLALPAEEGVEEDYLNSLIGEVNTNVLTAEDYLSGNFYKFNVA